MLSLIAQGNKSNCSIVRMRCNRYPIDDAIASIPSTSRADAIQQHLDATLNAERDLF